MLTVGFVGATGLMGHGIAKNIQAGGYPLRFTLRRDTDDRVADLLAAGATRVPDLPELGRTSDVVVICVTAAPDVEEVVAALLTEPKQGLIVVDTSTSEPGTTKRLARACDDAGATFVDAPLTLGPAQAEAGTLNVLVGADDPTYERVEPVLRTFAASILRPGDLGAGHTLKLLNNFVIQASVAALAEAFTVAAKAGIDPAAVVDILALGSADSALLHNIGKALHGDYAGMVFGLNNARKDVRYYTRMAGELDVPPVVGDGVHEALALAAAMGFGDEYVPSVVKGIAKLNHVTVAAWRK